jgi:uncharacterized protein YjbJ (UPF0337 family)
MNEKEVSGAAREVKGKVEKEVGKATGSEKTQAHGAAEEARGKVEKNVGKAKGQAENAKENVEDTVRRATE